MFYFLNLMIHVILINSSKISNISSNNAPHSFKFFSFLKTPVGCVFDLESANYGSLTIYSLLSLFINKVLLEHSIVYSFMYILDLSTITTRESTCDRGHVALQHLLPGLWQKGLLVPMLDNHIFSSKSSNLLNPRSPCLHSIY